MQNNNSFAQYSALAAFFDRKNKIDLAVTLVSFDTHFSAKVFMMPPFYWSFWKAVYHDTYEQN